ncbi:hypothetical protein Bpfe_003757 [Biomphalaria pfeifferi]|uniref:EF-hand domain-containing protein n=1 Tax=Biomphalaria pfeifferi TaxID=112525 RepID=A0AAD8FJ90_BIOPF|nr:hypothetical protein Bpfe_003757 [Biomphalaria pfeifferi]
MAMRSIYIQDACRCSDVHIFIRNCAMLFYSLIVLCFVTINQVSSDEYRKVLPQSFSIYGKSNIRALYKALEPAIISFFKAKHLTKEYFQYSIRQRDPWTQSVLKGRFYRMDPNKDGVMNEKDLNGYFRFVILSDMLAGGADANNDYTTRTQTKISSSTLMTFWLANESVCKEDIPHLVFVTKAINHPVHVRKQTEARAKEQCITETTFVRSRNTKIQQNADVVHCLTLCDFHNSNIYAGIRSIRPCEPWLEAALTDRFDRLDVDKNEVFDINDRTPFTVFTFLMDFCVMGADKNNDNSISEKEMAYFLSKAEHGSGVSKILTGDAN